MAWEHCEDGRLSDVEECWRMYLADLAGLEHLPPAERMLAQALVWQRLGEILLPEARPICPTCGVCHEPDEDVESRAIACFETSVKLAPNVLATHRALVEAWETCGKTEQAAAAAAVDRVFSGEPPGAARPGPSLHEARRTPCRPRLPSSRRAAEAVGRRDQGAGAGGSLGVRAASRVWRGNGRRAARKWRPRSEWARPPRKATACGSTAHRGDEGRPGASGPAAAGRRRGMSLTSRRRCGSWRRSRARGTGCGRRRGRRFRVALDRGHEKELRQLRHRRDVPHHGRVPGRGGGLPRPPRARRLPLGVLAAAVAAHWEARDLRGVLDFLMLTVLAKKQGAPKSSRHADPEGVMKTLARYATKARKLFPPTRPISSWSPAKRKFARGRGSAGGSSPGTASSTRTGRGGWRQGGHGLGEEGPGEAALPRRARIAAARRRGPLAARRGLRRREMGRPCWTSWAGPRREFSAKEAQGSFWKMSARVCREQGMDPKEVLDRMSGGTPFRFRPEEPANAR